MSPSQPIKITRTTHDHEEDGLSTSYLGTSPLAQEILARDLAECSTPGDSSDDEYAFSTVDASAPLSFHPPAVAYGAIRPALSTHHDPEIAPTVIAIEESRAAERSLLRDNHFLPPKHPRAAYETPLRRLYRRLFSTKVRDVDVIASKASDETTPLLVSVEECGPPTPNEEHRRFEAAVAAQALRTTWQREAKTLIQYSAPLIITFLLHYSVTLGSVLTVGRIGTRELGAVNLATMTATITAYIPIQGLATSLDTLCAQAFGSGHRHLVGLQAQRMTYMLWLLCIPIGICWLCADSVLCALVPDQESAHLAAGYLRILVLGTPGVAAFESGKRFVQAQGLFHATTYVLAIGAPLSFLLNYVFVWKFGWHFAGAAMAMAVTQNLLPALLAAYVWLIEGRQCWGGLSRRAFSNWGPMIRLALPGMIMIEAQFSVLEILTLAAGQFGAAPLAAQSVLVTATSTAFNVPFPLSIAASTRVANLIGARLADAARTSAKVAVVAGIVVGSINMTLFTVFRNSLPYIFTEDPVVVSIVAAAIPVCAVMQIFDALAAVSHGLLRGLGRQSIGGWANIFSYYCVALPVSLTTAFCLGWQLVGLWAGMTAALAVVAAIELLYLSNTDWDIAVAQAEDRMRSEGNWDGEDK